MRNCGSTTGNYRIRGCSCARVSTASSKMDSQADGTAFFCSLLEATGLHNRSVQLYRRTLFSRLMTPLLPPAFPVRAGGRVTWVWVLGSNGTENSLKDSSNLLHRFRRARHAAGVRVRDRHARKGRRVLGFEIQASGNSRCCRWPWGRLRCPSAISG